MKYLVLDIMSTNVRTSYYAKIGDKYVDFDRMPWYSAENAFGNIAERTYLIGVNTPNGWKYYEDYSWGNNGFVPSGQVSVASDAKIFRDYYIGSDANGYAMYQFDVYDMSSVDVHVLDGVEVYCQKGTTNDCYAKLSDNCYIRGYLTETGSGYSFTPEYWYETEFDSNELAGALQLHRLIKVNGDTATVPASVLEKLEKYSEHVRIRITRYSDYGYDTVATVNYSELQSWFED